MQSRRARTRTTLQDPWPLIGLLALLGCGGGDGPTGPVPAPLSRITITPAAVSLAPGETAALTATGEDSQGRVVSTGALTWISSNPAVATVSSGGVVTGVTDGSAVIRASAGGITGTADASIFSLAVAEEVVVVDSVAMRLTSDSTQIANGVLQFAVSGSAPSIEVGDVLVGAEGAGFVRRVTSLTAAGSTIVAQTEAASLEDAINSGSFEGTLQLDFTASPSRVVPRGNIVSRVGSASGEATEVVWGKPHLMHALPGVNLSKRGITLDGVDLCNNLLKGKCPSWLDMDIKSGDIDFAPALAIGASYGFSGIQDFHAIASGTLSADILPSVDASASFSADGEVRLLTIGVPFAFLVGPIPVKGTVILSVFAGFTASADGAASVEGGVTGTLVTSIGAQYANGQWSEVFDMTGGYQPHPPKWSASANANARVYVRPELGLVFYGSLSGTIDVEPYLKADGSVTNTDWSLSLDAGLESGLLLKASVLGFSLGQYQRDLFSTETNLVSLSGVFGSNQLPTASITTPADGATFNQGATIPFDGAGSDPEDGTLAGSALVWTSSLDGQFGTGEQISTNALSVGTHQITLTVTDSQGAADSDSISITVQQAAWCGTSLDFTGGSLPGGWQSFLIGNGPGLVNNRLQADPIDSGAQVFLTGSAPASTSEIEVQYDFLHVPSASAVVSHIGLPVDGGTAFNVYALNGGSTRIHDHLYMRASKDTGVWPNDTNKVQQFEQHTQFAFQQLRYTVTFRDGSVDMTAQRTDGSTVLAITNQPLSGFKIDDVQAFHMTVYSSTTNSTWIDNVSVVCR